MSIAAIILKREPCLRVITSTLRPVNLNMTNHFASSLNGKIQTKEATDQDTWTNMSKKSFKANWVSDPDDVCVLDGMLDGRTCSSSSLDYSTVSISLKIPYTSFAIMQADEQNEPIDVVKIPVLGTDKPPYKITIKPRSKAHADLIERSCAYAARPDTKVLNRRESPITDTQVEKLKK